MQSKNVCQYSTSLIIQSKSALFVYNQILYSIGRKVFLNGSFNNQVPRLLNTNIWKHLAMKKYQKVTMSCDIRLRIQKAILNSELLPNERIVEARMAEMLGVSLSPVREALRELEFMGLVETTPFSGCYVKELTQKDIYNIYTMRALLEGHATEVATRIITEKDLDALYDKIIEMDKALEKNLIREFTERDIDFLRIILDICGNEMLLKIWNMCLVQWTYVTTSKLELTDLQAVVNNHKKMYHYMATGKIIDAGNEARENVLTLCDKIAMKITVS